MSPCSSGPMQFRHFARMRDSVVLPTPARAGEQPGVMQSLVVERVPQGAHDVLLPDERLEITRPPLASEDLIGHRESRRRPRDPTVVAQRRDRTFLTLQKRRVQGAATQTVRPVRQGAATPQSAFLKCPGRRAGSSALAVSDYGCFVPDLTRFATPQCEGARRRRFYQGSRDQARCVDSRPKRTAERWPRPYALEVGVYVIICRPVAPDIAEASVHQAVRRIGSFRAIPFHRGFHE